MRQRAIAVALGVVISIGLLGGAEAGFRWLGPKPSYSEYDRHTRWTLRPGYEGPGPDLPDIPLAYTIRINDAGFRGTAIQREKPAGVLRIATLGDSVTFGFGVPEEDALAAKIAAMVTPDVTSKKVEWLNAGVPGFSTVQGLRHLERRVLSYSPDIVTIMFGWNDGWRAVITDVDRKEEGRTAAAIQSSRLLTFVRRGTNAVNARLGFNDARQSNQPSARVPRVSPAVFETILLKMASDVRAVGAVPVFVTLPAAFGPDRPPDSYFRQGWMAPRAELDSIRFAYAEATRRASAKASVLIVDCARLVPADPALFLGDGYHPNQAGFRVIAKHIAHALRSAQVLRRQ